MEEEGAGPGCAGERGREDRGHPPLEGLSAAGAVIHHQVAPLLSLPVAG